MNDQIKHIEYLKTYKHGDRLEVASFLNGALVNVDEFTKNELQDKDIRLDNSAIVFRSFCGKIYLFLNGAVGINLRSGERLSTKPHRLKRNSKIEITTVASVFILHFSSIATEKPQVKSTPFGVYLLVSLLLQTSLLFYCFRSVPERPWLPYSGCPVGDCCGYDGVVLVEVAPLETSSIGRGRGLSTRELKDVSILFSSHRDLNDSPLYDSLKSIELSGQLSHREIRRALEPHKDAINTCKIRFPDISHSVSFTIYAINTTALQSQTSQFTNCVFPTIAKIAFPVASDEKPVAVRIGL